MNTQERAHLCAKLRDLGGYNAHSYYTQGAEEIEALAQCLSKLMAAIDRMTAAAKGTDEAEMKLAANCINEAMSYARRLEVE